jgi:hypothetical protein
VLLDFIIGKHAQAKMANAHKFAIFVLGSQFVRKDAYKIAGPEPNEILKNEAASESLDQ